MTIDEFYGYWSDYETIIDEMNEKLLIFKQKNPTINTESQERIIASLRHLQNLFHRMYHDSEKRLGEDLKLLQDRQKLINRIATLEKENETLKKNIDRL